MVRENLLVSNPQLARLVHVGPPTWVFVGLPDAERERLEALQDDFHELIHLFTHAKAPADFRRCYRPGRVPKDLTFVDGMLRLVYVLERIERVLSARSTGYIDRRTQRVLLDDREMHP